MRTISFSHSEPSPDALWRGLLGGTVRVSAIILRQTGDVQREIRAAFDRIVQDYRVDDRLEVPVSVKLASGRKRVAADDELEPLPPAAAVLASAHRAADKEPAPDEQYRLPG